MAHLRPRSTSGKCPKARDLTVSNGQLEINVQNIKANTDNIMVTVGHC